MLEFLKNFKLKLWIIKHNEHDIIFHKNKWVCITCYNCLPIDEIPKFVKVYGQFHGIED